MNTFVSVHQHERSVGCSWNNCGLVLTALHSIQCTVYSVQCTVSVQCKVYSVQCKVYSVQCTHKNRVVNNLKFSKGLN